MWSGTRVFGVDEGTNQGRFIAARPICQGCDTADSSRPVAVYRRTLRREMTFVRTGMPPFSRVGQLTLVTIYVDTYVSYLCFFVVEPMYVGDRMVR
jgi:hypothetical protein